MSTLRCPRCDGEVSADDQTCARCGFPLGRPVPRRRDDRQDLTAEAGRTPGPTADDRPADMPSTPATPAGGHPTDAVTQETTGPITVCRSCGASNPAGRTLCAQCGMGLLRPGDVEYEEPRAWRRHGRILLLILAVAAGAVVGWQLLRDIVPPPAATVDGGVTSAPDGAASGNGGRAGARSAGPDSAVVLRPGDEGPRVRAWQETLRDAGISLTPDGVFGPSTRAATRRFQVSIGEEPTGEVTARTIAAGRRLASMTQVDIFLVRNGDLRRRPRRVDETQIARGAAEALLDAPLDAERDRDLTSAIPPTATLDTVVVDDGTATVRLSGFASDASGDLQLRVDQVVRTLTEFPSIDDVLIVLPDDEMAVFADADVPLDRPIRRTGG